MSFEDREVQELKLDEGCKLKAYQDTLGVWTQGYGHTHGVTEHSPDITQEQANEWLAEDTVDAATEARDACSCFDGLDSPRKGALTNMAFQLGGETLSTFHAFLNFLDAGNYASAADDLLHTLWYKQTPYRAARIVYRIKTGEYASR